MDGFDALLREAMVVCALLCVPVLAVAALCGTIVAIAQAATSVQEQTLSLLPKVVAVGVFVALFGAFGMHLCADLFHDALHDIPSMVYGS